MPRLSDSFAAQQEESFNLGDNCSPFTLREAVETFGKIVWVPAVAAAYLLFSLGAAAFALFWCAPLHLFRLPQHRREHLCRTLLRRLLRVFLRILEWGALVRVRTTFDPR